ncbi:MAG: proton-conducting transporter membrane subunit [Actinomycetota bacterium]
MAFLNYIINNINPVYGIASIAAAVLVNAFFGLSSKSILKIISIAVSIIAVGTAVFLITYSFLTKGIFSTMLVSFESIHLAEMLILLFISLNMLVFISISKFKEPDFIKIIIIFMFSLASALFLIISRNFLAIFVTLSVFVLANFQLVSGIQGKENPVSVIKFFLNSLLSLLFLLLGFSFLYAATDFKNLNQVMEAGLLENSFYPISLLFIAGAVFLYMFFYPLHGNYIKLARYGSNPVLPILWFYFLPAGLLLLLKFRTIMFYLITDGNSYLSGAILFLAAACTIGPAIGALSTRSLKRVMAFTYLAFMGLAVLGFGLVSEGLLAIEGLQWLVLFNLINLVLCFMPVWLIVSKLEDSIDSLKGIMAGNKYLGINLFIIFLCWLGMAGTSGFLVRYNILKQYLPSIRGGTFFAMAELDIAYFFIAALSFISLIAVTVRLMAAMLGKPADRAAALPDFSKGYSVYVTFFTLIILALGILGLFNIFGFSILPGLDITRLDFLVPPS